MTEVSVLPLWSANKPVSLEDPDAVVQRILHAAREFLGLDVAFISQFVDGERVFRYVDGDPGAVIGVGRSDPLEESYCHYVASGALPEFVPDPRRHPVSAQLAATEALGIGTHLGVPIRLPDGQLYGTFCCFARDITTSVQERDVKVVHLLAQLASEYLAAHDAKDRENGERRDRITRILEDPSGITMVFQPLVELANGRVFGVEALARFASGKRPDLVFADAWEAGLGVELELKAVAAALPALDDLPHHLRLGVNVSPQTVVTAAFLDLVETVPPRRLTVEVTEHAAVDDYEALSAARRRLSARGFRLAIDDVGTGFAGLNHILESEPDTLKIDAAVVRNVHRSPAKTAMVEALVSFGQRVGVLVVAEGIEGQAELDALLALGVAGGQGYYLGRPGDLGSITSV